MAHAAVALLDALPAELAERASFPYDDPGRTDWAFYPKEMAGNTYAGVPLYELNYQQRKLLLKLVRSGLSSYAYWKASAIMTLDSVLDEQEGYRITELRDPTRYWISIFGEPDPAGTWAWQFQGHHVSVNHTIRNGSVIASTPLFFGSNPAYVGDRQRPFLRPCADEEEAARELLATLDSDQMATALLDTTAPIDVVVPDISHVPDVAFPGDPPASLEMFQREHEALDDTTRTNLRLEAAVPVGLGWAELDAGQQRLLRELLDVYLERLPEDLHDIESGRLAEAGWSGFHFAWAGSTARFGPHYYRLHSPDLLIEYNCVQDDANHIHAVWRNPRGDFGEDPLRAHMERAH